MWSVWDLGFGFKQSDTLQKFTLPQPALCIGGLLQVELVGRTQTQEYDALYYIWWVTNFDITF